MPTAAALADFRARFEALALRAAAREARDAEREAPAPKARPVREVDPDALTSRATLAADAELADRPQVAYQGATVAPEFADHDPDSHADAGETAAPGDTPALSEPDASRQPEPGDGPVRGVDAGEDEPRATASNPVRPLPPKLGNAAWTDAHRARWARMEARVMVARLAGSNVIRGPWDGLTRPVEPEPMPAARSARGPPG